MTTYYTYPEHTPCHVAQKKSHGIMVLHTPYMKYLKKLDIKLVKGEYENAVKGQIRDPEHLYTVFRELKDNAVETMLGVYLDENLEVITYDIIVIGGEDVALVLPHEIFRRIIVVRARTFILIHNHPKGDPTPSLDDKAVINQIQIGAKNLLLNFLDFIIIGDLNNPKKKNYWSMFEDADGGEYALGGVL